MDQPNPSPAPAGLAARDAAVALVAAVIDRRQAFDALLDPVSGERHYTSLPPRDRRLAHAIAATALRRHGEIEALLQRLIERPPRKAGALFRILEVAIAQLLYMEVPDHAAVSLALVAIVADRDARHFKALANAVLRRVARERDTILAASNPELNAPDWLRQRWRKTYGEDATRRIAAAHLVDPSLDLSVKSDPEGWAERLGGIVLPTGSVRLVPSGPVDELPGFGEGAWWVQDAAAALPAKLLGNVAGLAVADLCAAPGGKTAALAAAGARVTAVDISPERLKRLSANLTRLGLSAETVAADILTWNPQEPGRAEGPTGSGKEASRADGPTGSEQEARRAEGPTGNGKEAKRAGGPSGNGKDKLFDAILLDAPCTSTGTIRRHPDIPWLKRAVDVASLAELQARMIDRVVPWLKPGGTLVYCTCSLEPEEGEDQLARALHRHPLDIVPVKPDEIGGLAAAITPAGAVRTLPFHLPAEEPRLSGLDGFFIVRLRKR